MMLYFENGGTIHQLTPTGLSNLRSQPNAGGYASPDFVGLVSYAVSRCAMNATCANAVAKVSTWMGNAIAGGCVYDYVRYGKSCLRNDP
ncbi:MAG: hypothetical protein AB1700_20205, partial [Bacillota bacterium]